MDWIKRHIAFHGNRHPRMLVKSDIESFPSELAVAAGVSARTQNQALAALLFLYKAVLEQDIPLGDFRGFVLNARHG